MEVTRQERCSYVKIAVLLTRNAKECHSELAEALGNRTLPYRIDARWATAFQRGRVSSADMRQTGRQRTVRTDVARAVVARCRQLCIKSYEKICICVILLRSGCHMHLLNNKNGVAMKLIAFIWKCIKMKERTCWTTLSLLMKHESGLASQLNGDMKGHREDRNWVRIHLL